MKAAVISLFRNKSGQYVVWQWPNLPLSVWIITKLLSMVIDSIQVDTALASVGTAFLFVWAYLEIASGASYFRRVMGVIVLAGIMYSFI